MTIKVNTAAANSFASLNRNISTVPNYVYVEPNRPREKLIDLKKKATSSDRKSAQSAMRELGEMSLSADHNISADANFQLASAALENPDPVNDLLLQELLEKSHHEDPHIHLSLSISHFLKGEEKEAGAHLNVVNKNAGALRPDLSIPPALVDQVSIAPESRVKKALLHRLVDEAQLTREGKTVLNHTYGMLDMGSQIIEYQPTDPDITERPFVWNGKFDMADIKQDHKSFNCFFLGALASLTYTEMGRTFLKSNVLTKATNVPGRLKIDFKDVAVYLAPKMYVRNDQNPYSPDSADWVNLVLRGYDLYLLRTQKNNKKGVGMRGGSGKELYEALGLPIVTYDPIVLKVTESDLQYLIALLKAGNVATLSKGDETHLYALIDYDDQQEAFVAYDPHGRFEAIPFDEMKMRFSPQSVHQRWSIYLADLEKYMLERTEFS